MPSKPTKGAVVATLAGHRFRERLYAKFEDEGTQDECLIADDDPLSLLRDGEDSVALACYKLVNVRRYRVRRVIEEVG